MDKRGNFAGYGFALTALVLALSNGVAFGERWNPINTGLPSAEVGVSALAIDPVKPSTVYARSFTGAIFKSTDGGQSWTPISNTAGATALVIDPMNTSTIYVGTGRGIRKSTDGGKSWFTANIGLTSSIVRDLSVDPVTPSTLYAVTTGG